MDRCYAAEPDTAILPETTPDKAFPHSNQSGQSAKFRHASSNIRITG